ncbi:MAG: FMN-binding protein [Spirochaetales bacterium]|nr:FMN-binding protein [Spirochaetales bacterium]
MSRKSQNIVIIGLKLFIICLISALLLSLLNMATSPQVEKNRQQAEIDALAVIIEKGEAQPANVVSEDGVVRSFYAVTDQGVLVSYVVELMGQGYGGDMKMLANYSTDGALLSAKLMDNQETPGLGKKAEDSAYMNKFLNKGGADSDYPIPYTKAMLDEQVAGTTLDNHENVTVTAASYSKVEVKYPWYEEFWYWFWGPPKSGNIDSVSGATITFEGLASALKAGSDYIKSLGGVE